MSIPDQPPHRALSRILSAILILVGIVLLLPGVCAGYFVLDFLTSGPPSLDPVIAQLWFGCFAVTAVGIALIWWAVRRLR